MKLLTIFCLCLYLPLLSSCVKIEGDNLRFEPKFIVEGSIEEGGVAVVKLTHNIPSNYIIDTAQLEHLIVRTATVKVSTDDAEEILTLVKNKEIFPFYYYEGRNLKGVAGKIYRLDIQYSNLTFSSTTEIPLEKPTISEVAYKTIQDTSVLPSVTVDLRPDGKGANYWFYTKRRQQTHFYATVPAGFRAKEMPSNEATFSLLRSRLFFDTDEEEATNYYRRGDLIDIKVVNISEETYTLRNQSIQQRLQYSFLAYTGSFTGNIDGPAIGIWHGENGRVVSLQTE